MIRVLYVDDEEALLDVCKLFLERSGDMLLDTTTSVKGAKELVARTRYDAIISDYQMPEVNGIEFLKELRTKGDLTPFILFTGKGREEVVIEALNSGADFYLQKGGNPMAQFMELEFKVKEAVRRSRAESALKLNEARLSKAQAIGQTGSWEYTWKGGSAWLWGSDESWRIFGMPRPPDGMTEWSKVTDHIVERDHAVQALREAIANGSIYDVEYQVVPTDGGPRRIVRSNAEVVKDQDGRPCKVVGVVQDITVKKIAEERTNRLNKELRAIKECNKAVIRARTEQDLVNDICRIIREVAGYKMAWIGMAMHDELRSVRPVAWSGDVADYASIVNVSWSTDVNGLGAMGTAIRTGESVIMTDLDKNPLMRPWREMLFKLGFRAMVAIPLLDSGVAFGAIGIYIEEPEGFTPEEMDLLEEMAEDLAFGILGLRAKERQSTMEAALRKSEERFRSLFEEAPIAVSISSDLVKRSCNRRFVHMFGFQDREEVEDRSILDFVVPWERSRVRSLLEYDNPGKVIEVSTWGLRKDSSDFPLYVYLTQVELTDQRAFLAFYTDVSERNDMEAKLRESEEKYRTFIERAPLAFALTDPSGRIIEVNPQFCKLMDCNREDMVCRSPKDLMLTDDKYREDSHLQTLHDKGMDSMHARLFRKDASSVPASVFTVDLPSGNTMAFIEDISERESWEKMLCEREEDLRRSVQKFQAIFDGAAVGIITTDLDGIPIDFNERFVEITGYPPSEQKHMRFTECTHQDDIARSQELYDSLRSGAIEAFEMEKRYVRKDGKEVWVHLFSNRLVDQEGRPDRVLTIVEDVTERKRMHESLRESEETYIKLVSTIPDIVIRTDLAGTILLVNKPALDRSGYVMEEVTGHSLFSFIVEEDRDKAVQNTVRMMGGQIGPLEYHLVMKDGERVLFEANGDVLRNADGSPSGLVFVVRDLTERRLLEFKLRDADRRLRVMDGITQHDTLNKLMALQGYIDLDRMGNGDAKRKERLDGMERIVRFLREQADNTREYQKIGVGRPVWQSVGEVCSKAVRNANLGKVAWRADVGDIEVLADPLLYKVFHNLIENSLRHGGDVRTISVHVERSGEDIMIVHTDDGRGISVEEKRNLFREGFGKDHGLGLFLSREILDITGMSIRETGEPGKGVRFEMVVPSGSYRNT